MPGVARRSRTMYIAPRSAPGAETFRIRHASKGSKVNPPSWDRRRFLAAAASGVAVVSLSQRAMAADPVKVGLIVPKTGPFASTGRQVEAACRLYMQKMGDSAGGRKIELVVRD